MASADFDGTNDYMTRGAGLTGAADSKTGILSLWIRKDGGDGAAQRVLSSATTAAGATERAAVGWAADNTFVIEFYDNAGAVAVNMATTSTFTASATWFHILASWNSTAGSQVTHLYVNDVSDKASESFGANNIKYATGDWGIGARPDGAGKLNSCLSEFYFAPGQFLDFSTESNRRKFITAVLKPAYLGADGSLPTGTAPIAYQRISAGAAVTTFATNLGGGGDFTITGTLTAGSTSPSD